VRLLLLLGCLGRQKVKTLLEGSTSQSILDGTSEALCSL
jgi:hypothetical protein